MYVQEPSSSVAEGSKFNAVGSVQPVIAPPTTNSTLSK